MVPGTAIVPSTLASHWNGQAVRAVDGQGCELRYPIALCAVNGALDGLAVAACILRVAYPLIAALYSSQSCNHL